jgi:hypothetical protein
VICFDSGSEFHLDLRREFFVLWWCMWNISLTFFVKKYGNFTRVKQREIRRFYKAENVVHV